MGFHSRGAAAALWLALPCALASLPARAQQAWVWPLSGTATADAMNTSFGPRINNAMWDFHDGMDLPAAVGTPAYAVADGVVFREGPGGTDGISSRHVVIQIPGAGGVPVFAYYLHLDTIAPGIAEGQPISQSAPVGTVGDDDATYSHLHFETRRGAAAQVNSVHPLEFLPFPPTPGNFTITGVDRVQRLASGRLARVRFTGANKLLGDLAGVEVDLRQGTTVLATRRVILDDKTTVNEGNGDGYQWRNDISLEGYQRSNMVLDGRTDLHEGILLRRLPETCDNLVVRVLTHRGGTVTGGPYAVGAASTVGDFLDFENGQHPPAGWSVMTSTNGTGTTLQNDGAAAINGARGLHPRDASTTEGSSQVAALETPLPGGRIEWTAEALIRPVSYGLASGSPGQNAQLLLFRSAGGLSCAAVIRNNSGVLQPGVYVRNPDASTTVDFASGAAPAGLARWTLSVTRIGTRETTIVLYLDGLEVSRKVWDGRTYEPDALRGGLGFISATATAEIHLDDLRYGDGGLASFPSFRPGEVQDLHLAKSGADLALSWSGACGAPARRDFGVYEGTLGQTDHAPRLCTTGGTNAATVTPAAGSRFFLVVPSTAAGEGSYGAGSNGAEFPAAAAPCGDRPLTGC